MNVIFGIIIIDIIQQWKTDKTLNALKDLSEPKINILYKNSIEILSEVKLGILLTRTANSLLDTE